MTIDEQLDYLRKGTTEIIRNEELRAKLEKSAQTGKPLRVKLGVDPTAPDIHLGHTVVIRKLRAFFFSSRRRHTICSRDWSSDVCSSDLFHAVEALVRSPARRWLGVSAAFGDD